MTTRSTVVNKWRVGTKVPLNVYEGDRPVCQCHNATDATRIVAAMNLRIANGPLPDAISGHGFRAASPDKCVICGEPEGSYLHGFEALDEARRGCQ